MLQFCFYTTGHDRTTKTAVDIVRSTTLDTDFSPEEDENDEEDDSKDDQNQNCCQHCNLRQESWRQAEGETEREIKADSGRRAGSQREKSREEEKERQVNRATGREMGNTERDIMSRTQIKAVRYYSSIAVLTHTVGHYSQVSGSSSCRVFGLTANS